MKKLHELSFEEIQHLYSYALDLATTYHKDAEAQFDQKEMDKGNKFKTLENEWTEYARLLDQELQNRVKAALGQAYAPTGLE
ncbi:hypothetical protein ACFPMF_19255 [Larkinella bovis]|uniref:Uncharacterized protein n=1 Tax=Larkinella bovis TaxID=683041 RepID=A0ABW0IEW7_9BACT